MRVELGEWDCLYKKRKENFSLLCHCRRLSDDVQALKQPHQTPPLFGALMWLVV
jgi:hypothetical protein